MKDLTKQCAVTGQPATPGGRLIRLYDGTGESRVEVARYYVNPTVPFSAEKRAEVEAGIRAGATVETTPTIPVELSPVESGTKAKKSAE